MAEKLEEKKAVNEPENLNEISNTTENTENEKVVENKVENPKNKEEKKEDIKKKSDKKDNKKKKKVKKENKFIKKNKEVFGELKKVTWPKFKDVMKKTGVVLGVVAFFTLCLLGIDLLLSFLHNLLINGIPTA